MCVWVMGRFFFLGGGGVGVGEVGTKEKVSRFQMCKGSHL